MRIAHPARSLISFTLNLSSPPKTGTVGPYDRHVFLCFKNPDAWLPHVEEDDLPKLVSTVLKTCKDDITVKTKVTICEGGEGTEFENGDVLIFPDMIKSKEVRAERCMICVEKQEEKKLPGLREVLAAVAGL
ncbi:hypothetical protein POTOM_055056 [Populus tomentosa]|uniref:Uncharacterized protein n=1 Tax=Populus tomentosa TaxID=118781 RepID=A0A8X7Y2N1_POPTO|nr:hypothetical protein POTOM_055056 [Populus tomentosa]